MREAEDGSLQRKEKSLCMVTAMMKKLTALWNRVQKKIGHTAFKEVEYFLKRRG